MAGGICGDHFNELTGDYSKGFDFLGCLRQGCLIPGDQKEAATRASDPFGGFLSNTFGSPHDHHKLIFKCERLVFIHNCTMVEIVLCKGNNTQKYKASPGKMGVRFIQFFNPEGDEKLLDGYPLVAFMWATDFSISSLRTS